MHIAFVSWRDLAHAQAGGSEVLVDRLARALVDRGHDVTLLCGEPVGPAPYRTVPIGGTYAQYLRAPFAHRKLAARPDLLVDVANGVPFFSPVWRRGPVVCLVHHVHREQWPLRFRAPLARVGWFLEGTVMPRVYRDKLFVACSPSTATALRDIGVDPARIRPLAVGTDRPGTLAPKRDTPRFLAFGRLVPHKRIDLLLRAWPRVFSHTGGQLVIAGDGPEAARLRDGAPQGVRFLGTVPEDEKWRLMSEAWLLVHPAQHEGWGIVIMEAAAAGTAALAFDVMGVRDSVVNGETGVLAHSEDEFVAQWIALAGDRGRRARLAEAAVARTAQFTWERSADEFLEIAQEAMERAAVRRS